MSSSCRVLVVDDNQDAAEMIGSVLQAYGHETLAVNSGLAGVAAVVAFQPHVVFLDIGMPDVNGFEVARHVRATVLPVQPLLVALTGWSDDETRRRIVASGLDGHLCKPAPVADLLRWIERACLPVRLAVPPLQA